MFGEGNSVPEQAPGRALGGALPIVAVLALGAVCGVAGAMLWSRGTPRRASVPVVAPPLAAAAAPADTTPQLRQVSIQQINGRMQVTIALDQMVPYDAHRLADPDRIYVDLHGLHIAREVSHTMQVNTGGVQRIRIAQTQPDTVRVVLDLDSSFRYTVTTQSSPPQLLMAMTAARNRAKLDKTKPNAPSTPALP